MRTREHLVPIALAAFLYADGVLISLATITRSSGRCA